MATDIPMNTLEHVVYGETELNALDVAGCKWRKPYMVTIPSKPTGVAGITVTRSASESNCDQLSATSLTSTGKVLYGDTLAVGATAATGYNDPTTSFTSGVSNNKVVGDVAVKVTAGTGKTYYVYYNKGTSTSGTLPSTTSRTYPNAATIATNNMAKSNTTANSYTVTYANGTATSGTLPSAQTSINTTTYTKNGWTTGASNYNDPDYANGASFGASSTTNLTLYPNFTTSTTNGGVTLGTNNMSKSNTTANSYTVTYAQGNASNTTNLPSQQTSINTTVYTKNGWTTTSGSTTQSYADGAATGALTANKTLYPCFKQSTTNGGVTLSSNTMSKSATTEDGYKVTYAKGTATSTTVPSAQTIKNTRSYTHSGWATSASGSKTYNKGAATGVLSENLTLYPYFDSSVTKGTVNLATNSMTKSNTEANSYTVTYANGTATSGTLPSTQTSKNTTTYTANGWTTSSSSYNDRDYANGASFGASDITLYPNFTTTVTNGGVTLGTNSMSKSNTTANSYTVTYAQGNASSTTNLPSKQTSVNTTTYTKNGWTTTSGSTTKTHANGAATGALTGNLTLYPCFSQSTTNGGVTLSSNTMSRSNTTENGCTVTYAQGNASNTTNLPSKQTATNTRSYTHNGWATSASGAKAYGKGAATGALSKNLTLYPYFDSSISTYGSVTVSSNTMSKSNTTESGYTLTYAKGTATSTTVPSAQTATDTRSYTHNGWATSASGSKAYNKGASTGALSSSITLYPYFDSSVTRGSVTLATNSMTKSSTNDYSYTVTYNYNGSGAANTTATATKTRTYTANGWTTTSGSTTRTYTNGQSVQMTKAITVYPCFSESTSGGSVTLPTPTRTGYTFKGWATSSTATSGSTGSYTPTGNVTLYAVWELNAYTLTISDITGVKDQSVSRASSPLKGAATGILANGATIYYGDVLSFNANIAEGYNYPTIVSSTTVTGNIKTSDYITAGAKVTSILAPNLDETIWEEDEDGVYLSFTVENPNQFPCYLVYSLIRPDGDVYYTNLLEDDAASIYLVGDESYSVSFDTPYIDYDFVELRIALAWGSVVSDYTDHLMKRITLSAPVITSSSQQLDPTGLGSAMYLVGVTVKNNNSVPVTATTNWSDASTGAQAATTTTKTIEAKSTGDISTFVNSHATDIDVKFTAYGYYGSPTASATAVGTLTAPTLSNATTGTSSQTLTIKNSNPVAVQVSRTCMAGTAAGYYNTDITSSVSGPSSISAGGTGTYTVANKNYFKLTITFSTWDGTVTSSASFSRNAINTGTDETTT